MLYPSLVLVCSFALSQVLANPLGISVPEATLSKPLAKGSATPTSSVSSTGSPKPLPRPKPFLLTKPHLTLGVGDLHVGDKGVYAGDFSIYDEASTVSVGKCTMPPITPDSTDLPAPIGQNISCTPPTYFLSFDEAGYKDVLWFRVSHTITADPPKKDAPAFIKTAFFWLHRNNLKSSDDLPSKPGKLRPALTSNAPQGWVGDAVLPGKKVNEP